MGLHELDIPLFIDVTTEGQPRITNTAPTSDPPKLSLLKLPDYFSNSPTNVTVVEISNYDIQELPANFALLNLKQLILNHTNLKEIPSCLFSGLDSLELLDLSHNLLTEFEVEPACSDKIVILKLSHNAIRNFPYWVLNTPCSKLREVYYSHNFVIKLDESRKLRIQKLEMCNSQLIDEDFKLLKRAISLEFLDIGNDMSGKRENRFKEINNLFARHKWKKMLTLRLNNLLLSIIPPGLFYLSSLVELHVVNCSLHWIPEEIRYLTNLQILDISHNSICSLPQHLTSLQNLCVVKAACNAIDMIDDFYNDLEIFDLYNNKIENFTFDLSRFTYIDLECNVLDTSALEDSETYKMKVDEFRRKFNLDRNSGRIELEVCEDSYSSDTHSSYEGSDVSDAFYDVDEQNKGLDSSLYYDIECWDDETPRKTCEVKNPHITASDDEWDGKEEIKVEKKKKAKADEALFDADEDWIFADVDEE